MNNPELFEKRFQEIGASHLRRVEKWVLLCLVWHMNAEGDVDAPLDHLARFAGMADRSWRRTLRDLELQRVVKVITWRSTEDPRRRIFKPSIDWDALSA